MATFGSATAVIRGRESSPEVRRKENYIGEEDHGRVLRTVGIWVELA